MRSETGAADRMLGFALTVFMLLLAAFCPPAHAAASPSGPPPTVLKMELHDTLQPERASVFLRTLESAHQQGYSAIVIDLSTPGGLSQSVDQMVAGMQRSRVPIIVWAGAPQTRISGEGLRLLAAADISLVHPGAFLTPLWTDRVHGFSPLKRAALSGTLRQRLLDSNAAHGRDTESVEELAFGTHWFTGGEAVENHVVDGTADKMQDVLRFAAGRSIHRNGVRLPENLSSAGIDTATVKLQELLLLTLMNPDICVLLLTLGLLLIYLEINTPGAIVPGAAGVLLVLLALYALHLMPLNPVGVVLCLLSGLLLLLEGRFPSHALLASAGVLTLVVGLGLLVNGPIPQLQVEWSTAMGAGLGFGGVTASLIVLGLEARRSKVKTGADAMLGWLAIAQTVLAPEGQVLVRGELWPARLSSSDSFVAAGERVKVLRADGHLLEVAAIPLGNGA
ncbi:MAG: NfeD family protein [Janthinobacterium lividum]